MSGLDASTVAMHALLPALAAAVTWSCTRFGSFLARRRRAAEMANAIVRIDHVVHAVVLELDQRAVSVLRQVTKHAGLGDAVKVMLRKAALAKTKELLGEDLLARLAKALGTRPFDVDGFLITRIEAAVHGLSHARRLRRLRVGAAPTAAPLTVISARKGS